MRQLIVAIDGIGTRTKFSGISLLSNGLSTGSTITLQVSNNTTDTITLAASAFERIGAGTTVDGGATQGGTIVSDLGWETSGALSGRAAALINAINHASTSHAEAATAAPQFRSIQTEADTYIKALSTQRSLLGAYQNQIEFTVSNVTELSSNLSAARSNVQDTDYALETASLTKGQILQQAATAMLAQANQMPNVILSLLK